MAAVIKVESVSKQYRLGLVGSKTLTSDVQRLWAKIRRKEDPFIKIGSENILNNKDGEYIWALRDINLEVEEGEVLGVIGKNGAGKSTLLKLLSRVTSPTLGQIKIKGRVASLLEVGTGFHPELTGKENIFLNGAILGMTKNEIKRKFDEIVDFSGVEKYIDTPVKRYSSGMYVRLAFAVAAHLDPEILIIDEVLAVGDGEFQKKCLGKMGEVSHGKGRTIIFVSHNMAAVQQLCQKAIILSGGVLTFLGDTNAAVDNYINSFKRKTNYCENGFIDLENSRQKVYLSKVFKRIRILDNKNLPRESFKMLSPMRLEIELNNTENYPEADYCVAIHKLDGQWITSFATWMFPNKKKKNPKMIILEIPSIKFSPGTYKIYLSMTLHTAGIYIDRIEEATIFHLESVDIFQSGREFTSDCGIFIPEGNLLVI